MTGRTASAVPIVRKVSALVILIVCLLTLLVLASVWAIFKVWSLAILVLSCALLVIMIASRELKILTVTLVSLTVVVLILTVVALLVPLVLVLILTIFFLNVLPTAFAKLARFSQLLSVFGFCITCVALALDRVLCTVFGLSLLGDAVQRCILVSHFFRAFLGVRSF